MLNGDSKFDFSSLSGSLDSFSVDFSAIGVDTITDFNVADDQILLDPFSFPEITKITSPLGLFDIIVSNGAAQTSQALIVYNRINGNLFYNQNGNAPGFFTGTASNTVFGGLFAKLTPGLNLTVNNIFDLSGILG